MDFIDDLYRDTKLNYKLYTLAQQMAEKKETEGKVVKKEIIEELLTKKGILDKMPVFELMLPEDYWED